MQENNNAKKGCLIGGGIGLAILLWVGISIGSIISAGYGIYVYNPHDDVLTFDIGQEHYILQPSEKRQIDISSGNFEVKSFLNGELILDTVIFVTPMIKEKGGIINLSGEPLYLWTEYYGSGVIENIYVTTDSSLKSNSPMEQRREQGERYFIIDSTILFGIIKEYGRNQLVIEKEWYYGIDESFEEEISTDETSDIALGKAISKLFDKKNLLKYWNERNENFIQSNN